MNDQGNQSDFQTRYSHADALGSVDLITDGVGDIVDKMNFDPFGKRRTAYWRTSQDSSLALAPLLTNRGFTGHEHVDALDIIHMNGRIYDPELGRFLSADPTMQFPYASQGQNRYAYTQNNPLKYVDPSGFGLLSDAWKSIKSNAKKFFANGTVRLITATAAAVFTFGAASSWAMSAGYSTTIISATACTVALSTGGGMIAAAAAGAAFGFVGSGGDLNAALTGAITAGALNYIGSLQWESSFATATAHGVIGGAASKANGGRFKDGLLGGFFGKILNPLAERVPSAGGLIKRILVGGTASKLGGGKFENGALSAAMAYAFNDTAPHAQERPSFDDVEANFPAEGISGVGDTVGGKVNLNIDQGNFENACAIRVCAGLNGAGTKVPFISGETSSGANGNWHIFRVRTLRRYLTNTYGAPDIVSTNRADFLGSRGIIIFDKQYINATGHADLWNGSSCSYNCDFQGATNVELWRLP